MTPSLAVIRIRNEHWWCPPIPVPLFLLWIPAILLAPLVLLVLWPVSFANGLPFWRSMATFWRILCALPGTHVRVEAQGNLVTVRIL
jgi:hypothetical protein